MTGRSVYRTWVLAASGLLLAVSSAWAAPAISVLQGTTAIAKGSTFVYPSTPVGIGTWLSFTITNSGTSTLNISNPTTLLSGSGSFQLTVSAPASIAAGTSGNFRVRLLGGTPGTFTATVTILSDAPNNTSFAFNVQGTVTGPTVTVQQGTAAIAKGSTYVYPASTPAGTPTSVQFTITNTGNATLNISNPTALVAAGSAFSLIISAPSSIAAGGNGVFRVRLQSATGGTFTGTVSISSDDSANNPFTFYVQGTVTAPLIGVLQGSTAVAKGSTFVYPGSTPAGVVYWLPFTITNNGSATLNISNPTALVTNGGGAFYLTVSAPSSIAAGSSGNFRVRLLSGTPGTYTGTVTINSDDPVNPIYSFNLQGTVTAAPAIGVQKSGSAIASGGTFTFPSTPAGLAESLTFTITNTGGATLTISNPSTLLTGSSAFSLTAAAPSSIAAGGSGTFVVRLLSTTPGSYTATVTINSNDPVTNPFTFTLQGTVNPAPAISVQQGTANVAKGSTYVFPASTPAGTPTSVQFTITNTGTAALNISNPTALVVGGSAFSLITNAPSSIPAGGNGVFRVRLQSATGGTFTGTVSIGSDDPLNNPFTFNVQGTVTAPQIGVLQGATAVAKGSTFVYPGSTPAGVVYWLPFTITNTGSATLNISNPTALVTNGGGAFYLTVDAPASIAAGSSGNFRVRLLSGTPGTYTGTVTINSDDPVNPTYSFNLQGTVAAAPAISVLQGGSAIASGGTFTFPSTPAGLAESLTFTLTNTGGATLNVSNPSTLLSGNSAFSLTAAAPSSIAAGGSGTFVVRLLSATPGSYTATVTINSNDPVTNPFTFTLQGTVNPAPAIGVQQGTTNVAKGSTYVYPASTPAGTPTSVQFTITNTGGATLNISNPTALVVGGSAFSLIINAPSSIPAGGNGIFRVRLQSATPGTFTGTVSIASDDPLNNPFTFTVQGTVDPASAISVQQGATAIANGGSFTFPAGAVTGVPQALPFTISNGGSATLTLSNPATLVSGAGFSESQQPAASIPPGGNATFAVQILSSSAGTYSGTVTINSNAPGANNPYTFTVQATVGLAPSVRVVQAWDNETVVPGGTVTFADVAVNIAESMQLLIVNDGPGTLTLANPSGLVSGACWSQLDPAPPASLAAGQSAGVRVRLLCGTEGVEAGSFTVASNDPNIPSYAVNLRGAVGLTLPPLRVESGDAVFVDHQGTYIFPDTGVGQPVSRGFTIFNDGMDSFTIANPAALVTGDPAFSESQQPAAAVIPAGGSQTFRVRLLSSQTGTYDGTVTIASADPAQKPFRFTVTGSVENPDFVLGVFPTSRGLVAGDNVSFGVTLTSLFGFSADVALSLTGLPAGATASYNPAIVPAGGTSNIRVFTSTSTPTGTYSLTLTATGGGITHAATLSLLVQAPQVSTLTITLNPTQQPVVQGGTAVYTVSTLVTGPVATVGLAVSGLPAGVTAGFDTTSVTAGGSAQLTLTAAAPAPLGSSGFLVTGSGNDGSTGTANGVVVVTAAQAPGAPTIDAITPNSMVSGHVTVVTVTGSNFVGATIEIPTSQTDPQNPVGQRYFPAASIQSVSPDGTSMQVSIDVSDPRIIDYYNLEVRNAAGKAVKSFRVLPPGPIVDDVSPSEIGVGQFNVMGLIGHHLRNVTLTTSPAGSLTISNFDSSQDDRTNAFLNVSPSAPTGDVLMTLTDPNGQQFSFTITIVAAGSPSAFASRKVVTGARISPVAPDIYFQDFRTRRPGSTRVVRPGLVVEEPAGPRLAKKDINIDISVLFYETVTLLSYHWQTAVVFDPVTGAIGDALLHGLGVGDTVRFGAYVFSFYAAIDATIYWSIDFSGDFTFPQVCLSGVIATEVPGLKDSGHYNITNCFGGNQFGNTSGTTSNFGFAGGPCASVTPVTSGDGIALADVTQDACCSQPIAVSGSGTTFAGTFFGDSFDFTTPNAGETTPGAECKACNVTIQPYPNGSNPPACIAKGRQVVFSAVGDPPLGVFQWKLAQHGGQASIDGPANESQVTVSGDDTSAAADDIALEVDYTVGGFTCSQKANLSVIDIALQFSDSGLADPLNDKRNSAPFGLPQLGAVRPNNPPGAAGYFENMQIKGTVTPCDANLRCSFDFKRLRAGSAGYYDPATGQFLPITVDCPQGGCDDDQTNADEDLTLDPAPGCGVFVVDTPGLFPGACVEGQIYINCFDFTEWLNVDNARATDDLPWFASTRLLCTNNFWAPPSDGEGNQIGQGSIPCLARKALAVTSAAGMGLQEAGKGLRSAADAKRLAAFRAIEARRAGLTPQERTALVADLLEAARLRQASYPLESTPLLAMRLLGELGAKEAIPVLMERLLDNLPRSVASDSDTATPASQALAALGQSALGAILDRAGSASDEEWAALRSSLGLMKNRAAVRAAVGRRLAAGKTSGLAIERLKEIDLR